MNRAVYLTLSLVLLTMSADVWTKARADTSGQPSGVTHWQVSMVGTSGGLLQWFPVYVARGMKFFEHEGVTLDWIDVSSGTAQAASVMGGSAEFAPMGMEHVVLSQKEGGDLMVVAALFDVYPHSLVLTKAGLARSGIVPGMTVDQKVAHLKGLTIGIAGPGGSTDVMLRNLLTQRHMDPDRDLRIQPLGGPGAMLAALSKGVVDGLLQSAPVDTIAQARGYGVVVLDPFVDDIPELRNVPFAGLLAQRGFIKAHPEIVAAVVRAIADAMRFADEHPQEAIAAVRPYVIVDGAPESVVTAMIERYRKGEATTPVVSPAQFAGTLRWVNLSEKPPIKVSMLDAVYNQAAQAAQDSVLKGMQPLSGFEPTVAVASHAP
jgi:NitT/TauT family transport system substrate-binding protein